MYGVVWPSCRSFVNMGGKDSVSVVLILYLSAIAPYMLGRVVDRGGDSTIESFVVHPRV
jgi:hypothetical protein